MRINGGPSRTAYSAEIKNFARSLHFHSPAAYEFVRLSFSKQLPHTDTLYRCNCSKNFEPGICEEAVDHISEKVREAKFKYKKDLVFNVQFDEMCIKKCGFYCK